MSDALEAAREALQVEAEAVLALRDRLGEEFTRAIELIVACAGRVVVTGMGKSGHVGQKIAGTLNSTGTPAQFLHPAEGVHGDLGMVTASDVLMVLSHSGDTEEILAILPAIRRIGVPIIAFTGRADSMLAQASAVVLDVQVAREACPLNLAPTASTTAMLALGDALAVALMQARRFTAEEFASRHPAGSLGRRLLLSVGDVMRTGDRVPTVAADTVLMDALFRITKALAGAAHVVDGKGVLIGIITDGDVRRAVVADEANLHRPTERVMTRSPKTITPDRLATEALRLAEMHQIADLPVVDQDGHPVGMINIKDLLLAGIV